MLRHAVVFDVVCVLVCEYVVMLHHILVFDVAYALERGCAIR